MRSTSTKFRLAFARMAVTVAIATALAPVASAPAGAATPWITVAQEQEIRDRMADAGIAAAAQESLLGGIRSGRLPDSASGAKPLRTFTEERADGVRVVAEYADGSRSWIEQPAPLALEGGARVEAAGLSACVLSSGWYVGCKVSVSDIVSSAGFLVDVKKSSANKAQLRDYRGKWCTNSIGACTVSGGVVRAIQSTAGPAWARLNYTASIFGGPSVAAEIGIRVAGTKISTY